MDIPNLGKSAFVKNNIIGRKRGIYWKIAMKVHTTKKGEVGDNEKIV